MDTKRMIIAMVVSFGLLFGWQLMSRKLGWIQDPQPVQQEIAPEQAATGQSAPGQAAQQPAPGGALPEASAFIPAGGQEVVVNTPLYEAVFNSNGGVLKSFSLKHYESTDAETRRPSGRSINFISERAAETAPLGLMLNSRPTWIKGENAVQWTLTGADNNIELPSGSDTLTFRGIVNGVTIDRTFSFKADSYVIDETIAVSGDEAQILNLSLNFATGELHDSTDYFPVTKAASLQAGTFSQYDSLEDLSAGVSLGDHISWAGIMGGYFLAAAMPQDEFMSSKAVYRNGAYGLLLERTGISVESGHIRSIGVSYFFGPKSAATFSAAPVDLSDAMDYGWFGWIAAPFLTMLKWLYAYCGNWGAAIILLTVGVKIVLWPLSYKSYKSMEKMKNLQPLMLKIREKYKDDKQRQNMEVMQLYKTYKVNPMGGCLPILVQMPVFFGLYRALLSSIELRHANFIEKIPFTDIPWLTDLSLKDPYYITPIIMGLTMVIQQKMTPSTGDPTQAKIMMLMPVVFTFMFANFPSGLVLYWLFNNIISIAQQQGQIRLSARAASKKS